MQEVVAGEVLNGAQGQPDGGGGQNFVQPRPQNGRPQQQQQDQQEQEQAQEQQLNIAVQQFDPPPEMMADLPALDFPPVPPVPPVPPGSPQGNGNGNGSPPPPAPETPNDEH